VQISVRSTLSDLSSSIDETREVATDLSIEHQRLAAELERMERAVAMSNGKPLPSLPPRAGTLLSRHQHRPRSRHGYPT
jgi:acetyl-CoA carboxylase alpha subunit